MSFGATQVGLSGARASGMVGDNGGFFQWVRNAGRKVGDVLEDVVGLPGEIVEFGENLSDEFVEVGRDLSSSDRARRIEEELREQQVRQAGGDLSSLLTSPLGVVAIIALIAVIVSR